MRVSGAEPAGGRAGFCAKLYTRKPSPPAPIANQPSAYMGRQSIRPALVWQAKPDFLGDSASRQLPPPEWPGPPDRADTRDAPDRARNTTDTPRWYGVVRADRDDRSGAAPAR